MSNTEGRAALERVLLFVECDSSIREEECPAAIARLYVAQLEQQLAAAEAENAESRKAFSVLSTPEAIRFEMLAAASREVDFLRSQFARAERVVDAVRSVERTRTSRVNEIQGAEAWRSLGEALRAYDSKGTT